jgi:hypothetical protein
VSFGIFITFFLLVLVLLAFAFICPNVNLFDIGTVYRKENKNETAKIHLTNFFINIRRIITRITLAYNINAIFVKQ